MSTSLNSLVNVLNLKSDALRTLLTVLEEEQRCLIELKADELHELSFKKEQVADTIRLLNESFHEALSGAYRDAGCPARDCLSPLMEKLSGPERETLAGLRARIVSVSKKIEGILSVNRGLLESSLGRIDRSLKFFTNFFTSAGTYSEAGRMREAVAGARLVCKEM